MDDKVKEITKCDNKKCSFYGDGDIDNCGTQCICCDNYYSKPIPTLRRQNLALKEENEKLKERYKWYDHYKNSALELKQYADNQSDKITALKEKLKVAVEKNEKLKEFLYFNFCENKYEPDKLIIEADRALRIFNLLEWRSQQALTQIGEIE